MARLGTAQPDVTLTPLRAVGLWCDYLQVGRGLSPHTLAAYKADVSDFFAGKTSLAQPAERIATWLKTQKWNARSKARHLTALRQFYAYALEKGWVETDPTEGLRGAKLPNTLPKALSLSEMKALLESPLGDSPSEVRLRLILQLLYICGLRVSELASLTLHDVSQLEGPWLRITGKGGKTRQVPLGPVAQETLNIYIKNARPRLRGAQSPWLLAGPNGKRPLTRVRLFQLVKEAGQRVGVAVAPHHLRHSFATHLLDGAADLRAVQLMLGHASLNTTQIYTKLTTQRLREAMTHHPLAGKGSPFGKKAKA